jgi:hypothetical protein
MAPALELKPKTGRPSTIRGNHITYTRPIEVLRHYTIEHRKYRQGP